MSYETTDRSVDLALLEPVLEELGPERNAVMPVLLKAQELYGYLSGAVLERVAKRLHVPSSEVYGVATFYPQFRFSPALARPELSDDAGYRCHEKDKFQWIPRSGSERPKPDFGPPAEPRASVDPCAGSQRECLEPQVVPLPEFARAIVMEER